MSPALAETEDWWECPECMTLITGHQRRLLQVALEKKPCSGCGRPISIYRPVGDRKGQ